MIKEYFYKGTTILLLFILLFIFKTQARDFGSSAEKIGVLGSNSNTKIIEYTEDDNLKAKYLDTGDPLYEGLVLQYWNNGNLASETEYRNGLAFGIRKEYDFNGKLERNIQYKYGKKDGIVEVYGPKGNLTIEISFVDGVLHGMRKTYYDNGQVKTEKPYNYGVQTGITRVYYENGQMEYEGELRDNKRVGDWKWYYKNGNLEATGSYKNGLEHGLFKFYKEDGKFKREAEFQNGESIIEGDPSNALISK